VPPNPSSPGYPGAAAPFFAYRPVCTSRSLSDSSTHQPTTLWLRAFRARRPSFIATIIDNASCCLVGCAKPGLWIRPLISCTIICSTTTIDLSLLVSHHSVLDPGLIRAPIKKRRLFALFCFAAFLVLFGICSCFAPSLNIPCTISSRIAAASSYSHTVTVQRDLPNLNIIKQLSL
jgi:hypothetical protein